MQLYNLAKENNIKGIRTLNLRQHFDTSDKNQCLLGACEGGSLELVHFMIASGANDFNYGLYHACKGNHLNIIQLMKSITEYNRFDTYGTKGTCERGDFYPVDYDIDWAFEGACKGGHLDLVIFLIAKGANNFNLGLYNACKGGQSLIVDFLIAKGANRWDSGLYGACEGGYYELVDLMSKLGATDLYFSLYDAYKCGNKKIIKYLINRGANTWAIATCGAYDGRHPELVFLLYKNHFDGLYDNRNIFKFLLNYLIVRTQILPVNNDIQLMISI